MLSLSTATRVFVALEPVDMRQSFNGLYARVQSVLQQEPTSGHWFVFTNRSRNRLKILLWDGSGLWVCANMHAPQCAVIKGRESPLSLSSFIR
jgi:transposase